MSGVEVEVKPGVHHPTAIVDEAAHLAESVSVGPFSIVGPNVHLEKDVRVGSHVLIERDTRVGPGSRIHKGAVLGTDAQDTKYAGEEAYLEIGRETVIREYATLNRGTAASGRTIVGDECLIMAYAHVAHDCHLGDHVILANTVNMGGHVEIGEWAIVGGMTAIHQFVRIGTQAFVGGFSRIPQDVPPYLMVAGNPSELHGINREGLRRRDFDSEAIGALRRAYRTLFRSELNIGQALDRLEERDPVPEVAQLVEFIRASERGIIT